MSETTVEVPDQVMIRAHAIVDANPHLAPTMSVLVAKGIMDERERCAHVAEDVEYVIPMWDRPGGPPGNGPMRLRTPKEIAAAIRKGEA